MPPLSRERLAPRRTRLQRNRRALVSAAIPVLIVLIVALVLGLTGGGTQAEGTGPLASPVPSPELGTGAPPPEVVIARVEGVPVHVPVDPERITAAAFHPISEPTAVGMEATGGIDIAQLDRRDRGGPETAGLDVGAPAGTAVYAPVDGIVASVSEYVVLGRIEGYEITIAPSASAAGLLVRITHLDPPPDGEPPSVGTPVRAGETLLGRVRDFSGVVEQELSQLTADSGNHVHIDVIRTRADLLP